VRDGVFTGELDGPFVYGEGKVEAMRAIARERGYDLERCYAYSDSISDRPMLELVGHPVAVNPDRGARGARTQPRLADRHLRPPREAHPHRVDRRRRDALAASAYGYGCSAAARPARAADGPTQRAPRTLLRRE
jgi:hypothetical protein